MEVNHIMLYGEKVEVTYDRKQLGEYINLYGVTMYEDMAYEVYTDGYGNMKALFVS